MGSAQSSDIKNKKRDVAELAPTSSSDVGSSKEENSSNWIDIASDEEVLEEEEEDFDERLLILKESRKLKRLADFFAHPEKKVHSDGAALGRCYFDRPSAPMQEPIEESEERASMLRDMKALKKLAVNYRHPELPVETSDATACARCYFDRASAPQPESVEEAGERATIMKEAQALEKLAVAYRHPEIPVRTSNATACARCYFDRASAPRQETTEEADERTTILEELEILKKAARVYLHPEDPVVTSGSTIFGRNYFYRASAPEQESMEDVRERADILKDAEALKKQARYYLHPEAPVVTDPALFGRNYFNRASAPQQESMEDIKERVAILGESLGLKKLAITYRPRHPELPVITTGPTVFGRNYFCRPSAPEQETEEMKLVLKDARALRKLAMAFRHPELPLVTTDPTVFGRNYFTRPSATPQVSLEDDEERDVIFEECHSLEKLAIDYHHPEIPVVTDPHYFAEDEDSEDYYHHHAHFDMDDFVHQHHVQFDKDTAHHDEITEMRSGTNGFYSSKTGLCDGKPDDGVDFKFSQSPGCVMTCFANPVDVSSIMAPELSQ